MAGLQGVFVDFYGTLAAGDRMAVEAICAAVVRDHDLPISAPDLASRWGDSYFTAIEAAAVEGFKRLVEIERDTLVQTVQCFTSRFDPTAYIAQFEAYMVAPPLFEEVHAVLSRLHLPVCIVSNADEHQIRGALAHHGLKTQVVTSEAAEAYKPSAKIFEYALEQTGWLADRVLHVGDSLHSDVGGAHAAGIRAAWVCRTDRIKDIGIDVPDLSWQDLRPLLDL